MSEAAKLFPNANHNYKHLTPEDVDHFLTKGWLNVPNSIDPKYIDKWMEDMWVRIGYDEHDKSTWKQEYLHLPRHREVRCEEFCPAAWDKVKEIVGGEEYLDPERERYYGDAFIINFGTEERTHQTEDDFPPNQRGFHCDDDWYRMFLDSSGNAMTVILCFTDIPPRGAGTWVCQDGLAGVVKRLEQHPEGFDPPISGLCDHTKDCKDFLSVSAKKGDVILLHGLLPHSASPNFLHYARVIANPHVSLRNPHNLNRPDGNYSLLEQCILRGLDKPAGVPNWKPARERKFWYPRNAGFKRAYVQDELKRMMADAKAKGKDPLKVDSVYLRGGKEFEEFEKHNGFDKPINTLLMEQHESGFDKGSKQAY